MRSSGLEEFMRFLDVRLTGIFAALLILLTAVPAVEATPMLRVQFNGSTFDECIDGDAACDDESAAGLIAYLYSFGGFSFNITMVSPNRRKEALFSPT